MKEPSKTIVALFARGREIGFAVLERGELVRYGVKSVKGTRHGSAFNERVKDTLSPLLAPAEALIVTERIPATAKPGALCAAVSRQLERRSNIRVLSVAEAKKRLCGNGKATHCDLAEAVAERYPILRPHRMGNVQRVKYWERVFLAVALADAIRRK